MLTIETNLVDFLGIELLPYIAVGKPTLADVDNLIGHRILVLGVYDQCPMVGFEAMMFSAR